MIDTRLAELSDAARISALLMANVGSDTLRGRWPTEVIAQRLSVGEKIIIATDEADELLGALLTRERTATLSATAQAMLKAWPGSADAYLYGPVCVAAQARGRGVLEALYADARRLYPGREAILFVKKRNVRSLRAHVRFGMRQVARFDLDDETFVVLSDQPPVGP